MKRLALLLFALTTAVCYRKVAPGLYWADMRPTTPNDPLIQRGFVVMEEPPYFRGRGVVVRFRGRLIQLGWGRASAPMFRGVEVDMEILRGGPLAEPAESE